MVLPAKHEPGWILRGSARTSEMNRLDPAAKLFGADFRYRTSARLRELFWRGIPVDIYDKARESEHENESWISREHDFMMT